MTQSIFNQILTLCKEMTCEPTLNCVIVKGELGDHGSVVFADSKLESLEDFNKKGEYIRANENKIHQILWTDFSETQPYNRQGEYYGQGASWDRLIQTNQTKEYREFQTIYSRNGYGCSSQPAVGEYNDYWNYGSFSAFISRGNEAEFLTKLRKIISKPNPFK